ncbi:MAG: HAD-IB family phosphatase, partial [Candidatus Hydrothermarchaeaceae archaeon]
MKLVAFDMDGTLIEGRTIYYLARAFNFFEDARRLIESDLPLNQISLSLASHLKGAKLSDALKVVSEIPLMEGAREVVGRLRELDYKLAIVTDSYDFAARTQMERLEMDDFFANELIVRDGVFTGELLMPGNCPHPNECQQPSVCKKWAFFQLVEKYGVDPIQTIAVGDNIPDICMVEEAGTGIAFHPKIPELEDAADVVIREKDLRKVLDYI